MTMMFHLVVKALLLLLLGCSRRSIGQPVPGDTLLNHVPFLMSHDAATGYLGKNDMIYTNREDPEELVIAWTKTQMGTITDQINCGARAFDMRPYLTINNGLQMHHGGVIVPHPFKDAMQEMVQWAADNPNELLIAQISACFGETPQLKDECDSKAMEALAELNIHYIYDDVCNATSPLEGMTLDMAKNMGKLPGGGSVLAIWRYCWMTNYIPAKSNICSGYEYESAGVSRKFYCWMNLTNPDFAVTRLFRYLDAIHEEGPPQNGSLWMAQALWQVQPESVLVGGAHGSSILADVVYSRINRFLFGNLTEGRWGTPGVDGFNMLEVDNVCDQGTNIALALDPRNENNVSLADYPDKVVIVNTGIHDSILAGDSVLFPHVPANFTPRVFQDTTAIRRHHHTGRFGNTNDIYDFLVSENEEKQREYLVGILGTFIVLVALFVVWGCLLFFLKLSKRLDCLSRGIGEKSSVVNDDCLDVTSSSKEEGGSNARNPQDVLEPDVEVSGNTADSNGVDDPQDVVSQQQLDEVSVHSADSADMEQNKEGGAWYKYICGRRSAETRMMRIRCVVLFSGFFLLLCSGLLIGLGFKGIADTLDSSKETLPEIRRLLGTANLASHRFLIQANQTHEARFKLLNELAFNCNFSGEALGVENATELLIQLNETLQNNDFLGPQVTAINRSLTSLQNAILSVENTVYRINTSALFPIATAFVLLIDAMTIVFMIGVCLAWKKQIPRLFSDCTSKVALPLYIFVIAIAYLMSALATAGASIAADFCIDTPDNQVIRLFQVDAPFDEFVEYYVRGCDSSMRPDLLLDAFKVFEILIVEIDRILTDLSNLDRDTFPCINRDFVFRSILNLQREYNTHTDGLFLLAQELNCVRVNPIYTAIAYRTTCIKGFESLAEIFGFLFAIGICAMTIISLRVAFYEVDNKQDQLNRLENKRPEQIASEHVIDEEEQQEEQQGSSRQELDATLDLVAGVAVSRAEQESA